MWFRKLLAAIIIVIFIPLFIINILVFSLKTTLLNPLYIQQNFEKNNTYEKIINYGLPLLAESVTKEGNQLIKTDDLVVVIKESISTQWLEDQSSNFFSQFNNYLVNNKEEIVFNLDLKDFKSSLSDGLNQFSQERINDLPTCTDQEIANMDKNNRQLNCLPENFSKSEVSDAVKQMFSGNNSQGMLAQIPNEYDLGKYLMGRYGSQLDTVKSAYKYLSLGIFIISAVNLLLLILISLVIWKPFKSVLKWDATAILIPSGLLVIISTIAYIFSSTLVTQLVGNLPAGADANNVIQSLILNIIKPFIFKLAIISGVFVFVSIAVYTIAYCLRIFYQQPSKNE